MKKGIILCALFLLLFAGCKTTEGVDINFEGHRFDPAGWKTTFFDDFDTLDRSVWKFNKHGNGIRGAAYYVDDSDTLFTEEGNLIIRTEWKDGIYGEGYYTSWLETAKNRYTDNYDFPLPEGFEGFNQKYGYFEIRCKVPKAQGIWSAFWLLPENTDALNNNDVLGTGVDGAEIDIYESAFYYKNEGSYIQHAIHCDYNRDNPPRSKGSHLYRVEDVYDTFHTYAIEWNEEEYIFYIDGYETWRTDHFNGTAQVEEFMLISVEVGGKYEDGQFSYGSWAGDPAKNSKEESYDLVVDYVRVMEKEE